MRAVFRLASRYGSGPVSLRTISEEEGIPLRYLEQLMVRLRREGLVESVRGPGGGYTLGRPPHEIKVGEVIQVLEGGVWIAECVEANSKNRCFLEQTCVSRGLWLKLSRAIQRMLNDISLQELMDGNFEGMDSEVSFKNRGAG